MSSISAKIAVISKLQSAKLGELLESISETMQSTKLSPKETEQLCDAIIPKVSDQIPLVCRAAISIVKNIIQSGEYPKDFPMKVLVELKKAMGHHKKKARNDALNMTNDLISIVTPEVFWEHFSDILSDKNNFLKEAALILFQQTIINFTEFKTKKYLKPIFSIFKEKNDILRKHVLDITQILYKRNPSAIEKLLKNQFSLEADIIIKQLKEDDSSDVSSVSSKFERQSKAYLPATASYSSAMNVPRLESMEDVENDIISSFDLNAPDATPNPNPCPFKELENMLKKSADWQDRMAGLDILLSHARGTQNPSSFLREMRTIQDQYSDCLSDPRSALCKHSYVVLVGLAQVFRNQLDMHSDWIISSILPKTNIGTMAISKAAEIAIVKYVQYVQGKHIKNILLANVESISAPIKVTVVRSMIVAKKFWSQSMSSEFDEILKKKAKSDRYKEVREAAANGMEGIKYIDFNAPIPAIKKSKIAKLSNSTMKIRSKSENENSEEQESEEVSNDNDNFNDDDGDASVADKSENNENTITDDINSKDILNKFFEDKNTKGLLEFIQNNKPDLFGLMQNVVDLIILDLNDEEGIENATLLLKEVCENYKDLFSQYVLQILVDLPEDEKYGMQCLSYLGKALGNLQLAKLLRQSNLSYRSGFVLDVAEKTPDDINFQSDSVLDAIKRGQYEKYHLQIFGIIKNIYEHDQSKCETLFTAMSAKDREEILDEYRFQFPTIYSIFYNDKKNDLPVLLAQEFEKAKNGNKIDFNLILDVPKNDPDLLLLAIAAIRESPEFDPRFVDYLINLSESNDQTILGAVSNALMKRCESDPDCCMAIANSFVPTFTAFNSFANSIKYSNKNEAVEALLMLKDQMIEGLQNVNTKYAILSILANAIKFIGEEYRNFCGKLSFTNESLLNAKIMKINAANNVQ